MNADVRTPIAILIVDDSESDAGLLIRQMEKDGFAVRSARVECAAEMSAALKQQPWDLVLCDSNIPGFGAAAALTLLRETESDVPFLIVSGVIDEPSAVELMRTGAQDYLMKRDLGRLAPAVRRELWEARERRRHRRADAMLRASEERFRTIADSASDAIVVVDAGDRIRFFNRAAEKMFGYLSDEAVGQPTSLLMPEAGHPAHDTGFLIDVARRRPRPNGVAVQQMARRKGGESFPVELTISQGEADGGVIFTAIIRDITQRKAAEAERERHETQVRTTQKMEAIGTLASGIAHDFNNILLAIGGYTDLAMSGASQNPDVLDALQEIATASKRAVNLVHQILAFSRHESEERTVIFLGPVVAEALALLRAAVSANITFTASLAPDAHAVLANATQIHQVIMNLGTNAVHAMRDQPGTLEVALENCIVDAGLRGISASLPPGRYVRLRVRDNGRGMDEQTAQRIFDPFFTTKTPGQGTGLGLSVVHGIMRSNDGEITVQTKPGEGSTFDLYFPAVPDAKPAPADADTEVPQGHGERILLIDDELVLVKLGKRVLERLGYAVDAETTPARALELVRAAPGAYALVVTDLHMPDLLGTELAVALHGIDPELPILLTSGNPNDVPLERVRSAGIVDVLPKPFTFESLGRAVQRVLRNRRTG